jgi:hypothetical protein
VGEKTTLKPYFGNVFYKTSILSLLSHLKERIGAESV